MSEVPLFPRDTFLEVGLLLQAPVHPGRDMGQCPENLVMRPTVLLR